VPPLAAAADPLADWFAESARDLPWRRRRSGYHALVSELMLQQTQVSRVLEKFDPFIRRFPTATALANASEGDVLAAWQGLGYYRRARLLHAAAKAVVERHGGEVPSDVASLLALPGVGRYTAGAIASIVHGARAPIVDGNVTRVFQRLAAREGSASDRAVSDWAWREAAGFVSAAASPAASNEALMELGATVCTPANPRCLACPVSHLCAAHRTGKADRIPAPKKRAARRDLVLVCARMTRGDGAVLLEQRPTGGLWGGLWQPPTVESADGESLGAAAAAELLGLGVAVAPAGVVPFATTHRSIRFVVFEAKVRGKGAALGVHGRRWVTPRELPEFALSNAAKRVLDL
jgi:A/G-specific adenine glycosylase